MTEHDGREPDVNEIRPVDVARAARFSLASQNQDGAAMSLVLAEVQADDPDDGEGVLRFVSALGAQGAVLAGRLSPRDPALPLLDLIANVQALD